jgi:hypothetical protein
MLASKTAVLCCAVLCAELPLLSVPHRGPCLILCKPECICQCQAPLSISATGQEHMHTDTTQTHTTLDISAGFIGYTFRNLCVRLQGVPYALQMRAARQETGCQELWQTAAGAC